MKKIFETLVPAYMSVAEEELVFTRKRRAAFRNTIGQIYSTMVNNDIMAEKYITLLGSQVLLHKSITNSKAKDFFDFIVYNNDIDFIATRPTSYLNYLQLHISLLQKNNIHTDILLTSQELIHLIFKSKYHPLMDAELKQDIKVLADGNKVFYNSDGKIIVRADMQNVVTDLIARKYEKDKSYDQLRKLLYVTFVKTVNMMLNMHDAERVKIFISKLKIFNSCFAVTYLEAIKIDIDAAKDALNEVSTYMLDSKLDTSAATIKIKEIIAKINYNMQKEKQ